MFRYCYVLLTKTEGPAGMDDDDDSDHDDGGDFGGGMDTDLFGKFSPLVS